MCSRTPTPPSPAKRTSLLFSPLGEVQLHIRLHGTYLRTAFFQVNTVLSLKTFQYGADSNLEFIIATIKTQPYMPFTGPMSKSEISDRLWLTKFSPVALGESCYLFTVNIHGKGNSWLSSHRRPLSKLFSNCHDSRRCL